MLNSTAIIFTLLALQLVGCTSYPVNKTRSIAWIRVTPDTISRYCPAGMLACAIDTGNLCIVVAPDPPLSPALGKYQYTPDQWAYLGHEVKHCFDGKFHPEGEP